MTEVLGGDTAHWIPSSIPGSVSRDELADRLEVVAALLDDHGRQAEGAERAARRAVAVGGHPQRALGVAGGGVDAERDDERLAPRSRGPAPPARRPPRASGPSPEPGASGRLRLAPSPGAAPVSVGEAEEVGEPAGARVDVDGAGQDVGVARRRSPGCRCRGGRRCRSRRPGRRARSRSRAAADGRVVEVAGAAEAGAGRVVARAGGSRRRRRARPRATRSAAVSAASTAARAASQVPGPIRVIVS